MPDARPPAAACPACGGALSAVAVGGAEVATCSDCSAGWLDAARWRAMARGGVARVAGSAAARVLACPRCPGTRLEAGTVRGTEGIEVDRCPSCGGVFVDAGELEVIRGLAAAGPGEPPTSGKGNRTKRRLYEYRPHVRVFGCWITVAAFAALVMTKDSLVALGLVLAGLLVLAFGPSILESWGDAHASAARARPRDAPGPERAAAPRPAAAEGGLTLRFDCAQCGAPVALHADERTVACDHCGSWSLLLHARVADACVAEAATLDEEELRESWIDREVARSRAAGEHVNEELESHLTQAEDAAYRRLRLRERVRIGERRVFHVPYAHAHGRGVQTVFGRDGQGTKRTACVGFEAGRTEPAHDGSALRLNDEGLRLHLGRLRLLSARDLESGFEALPVARPVEIEESRLRGQVARHRDAGLSDLVRTGTLCGVRSQLVYKPYCIARVHGPGGDEWMLADGQTGVTIGAPSQQAVGALVAALDPSPLREDWEAAAVLVPRRCPECGQDLEHDPTAWFAPCRHCLTGLARGDDGIARRGYAHVRSRGREPAWLPAWRFATAPRDGGDRPPCDPPFPARPWCVVPAVRLLGTLAGDRAFMRFAEWAHSAELDVIDQALPPARTGPILGATLTAEDALALGQHALLASLTPDELRTIDTGEYRAWLAAQPRLVEPQLVLLPGTLLTGRRFQPEGQSWHLPGPVRLR